MAEGSTAAISQAATEALTLLGQGMLAEAAAPGLPQAAPAAAASATGEGDVLTLAMGDMIGDHNNEVVLFNDSGLKALAIATDAALVGEGDATHHVTAGGEDVSGFHYLSFDNGVTLYYQGGLDVLVRGGEHI
jgi:hypothetical protein